MKHELDGDRAARAIMRSGGRGVMVTLLQTSTAIEGAELGLS